MNKVNNFTGSYYGISGADLEALALEFKRIRLLGIACDTGKRNRATYSCKKHQGYTNNQLDDMSRDLASQIKSNGGVITTAANGEPIVTWTNKAAEIIVATGGLPSGTTTEGASTTTPVSGPGGTIAAIGAFGGKKWMLWVGFGLIVTGGLILLLSKKQTIVKP